MKKTNSFKSSLMILLMCFGFINAWGQTTMTYTFNSNSWGASPNNWISGKAGNQFTNNQGIQVTANTTGAYGNSPVSFSNISEVVIYYTTNATKGAGTINAFAVNETSATAQAGTGIGTSQSVTTIGGTSVRSLTFTPDSLMTGYLQIYVTCTQNSIYIHSIDITYNEVPSSPCDEGTLTAGTAQASSTEVTSGSSTDLSLDGVSTGTGLTYQWQSSANETSGFTNIDGATAATYTATNITATTYYRCEVTCNESATEASIPVLVSIAYCTPTPSSQYEYISNVTVSNEINNTTVRDDYTFYPSPIANLTIGVPTPVSVSISDGYTSDNVFLYIDWNQDGDWSDSNEAIALTYTAASGAFTATGLITPPAEAFLGNTRMRVKLMDGNNSDPCGTYTWGEIEDYTVNIIASSPTLIANPVSLSGFTYPEGFGPSDAQSFSLSGNSLDGSDVELLAGEGYEISTTNDDEDFSDTLTLPGFDGTSTDIYVRLAAGQSEGTYDDIILVSGGDAEDIEVALSGSVTAAPQIPVVTEDELEATVDEEYSYQIDATETPDSYAVSSEELPDGLSLDTTTGIISGTPTQAGEFIFGVTATNIAGDSEEAIFTMNVAKGTQTVTGLDNLNTFVGDADITLPETTEQGITIEYISDNENVATIDGNTLTIVGVGIAEIVAGNDGNDNYEPFTTDSFTITVTELPQVNLLVISQVYGGGGNSGAPYKNDFVELYNPTGSPINLDGLYIQYASTSGSFSTTANNLALPNNNIAPRGYFLIQLAGGNNGVALPTPDTTTGNINMSGTNGKVVLTTQLISNTGNSEFVIDLVGFGSANNYEGTGATQTLSNSTAAIRKNGGNQDINDNSLDFRVETPTPRNSTSPSTTVTWTTGNIWSDTPAIDKDVVIEGNLYVTSSNSFEAKSLTVKGSLTIEENAFITVQGSIANQETAEDFVVASGGNLIQTTDYTANDNVGDITVQRESQDIVRLDYTFWSSPVNGQLLQEFSSETLWNRIYTYETNAGNLEDRGAYEQVFESEGDADFAFANGKGYLFRAPNNWDTENNNEPTPYTGTFTGTPFNGNTSVDVYGGNGTIGGFTSIGNPYPSNIRAAGDNSLYSENADVIDGLYFWNNPERVETSPGSGVYEYVGTKYVTCSTSGCTKPGGDFISVGQGFIVKTLPNASENSQVTFTNAMRVNDATTFFKTEETERHRFWLSLSNADGNELNQILTGYMTGATNDVDQQIDGELFGYEGSAIYNVIGNATADLATKFVIQGRALPFETSDVVPLGFRATEDGIYSISLTAMDGLFADGQTIYLKDKQLGTIHNLSESAYEFESIAGEFNTRFEIVYEDEGTMGMSDFAANAVQIYTDNKDIVISSKADNILSVEVYDLQGRKIHRNDRVNATVYRIKSASFGTQVLVVRVQTQNGEITSKKVINN